MFHHARNSEGCSEVVPSASAPHPPNRTPPNPTQPTQPGQPPSPPISVYELLLNLWILLFKLYDHSSSESKGMYKQKCKLRVTCKQIWHQDFKIKLKEKQQKLMLSQGANICILEVKIDSEILHTSRYLAMDRLELDQMGWTTARHWHAHRMAGLLQAGGKTLTSLSTSFDSRNMAISDSSLTVSSCTDI